MTPKEKAKQLIEKYQSGYTLEGKYNYQFNNDHKDAKQCALIAVDEIKGLETIQAKVESCLNHIKYWNEVKQEIEKL